MAEQRLHSALAPVDVLTRLEHETVMRKELSDAVKARYFGIESQRFPRAMVTATGTSVNLFSTEAPTGPEQGDFWQVRRVVVKSNSFTDTAKYLLFRGTSPSDIANAYGPFNLLEALSAAISAPVPSQPAVPATGVAQQNVNQFPVQVVISPNGATITNVSVNGITVGTAAGTYTVPANGSISIAYSVATPTWVWSNLNTAVPAGIAVNTGYYPATKSLTLQPGEQLYALVVSATSGNVYMLDGEAIRVPAEMKGKILS